MIRKLKSVKIWKRVKGEAVLCELVCRDCKRLFCEYEAPFDDDLKCLFCKSKNVIILDEEPVIRREKWE